MNKQPSLTRAEFLEKYGEVWVRFSHLYKNEFVFTGKLRSGQKIVVYWTTDFLYGAEFYSDSTTRIKELEPFAGNIVDASNNIIESFYDWRPVEYEETTEEYLNPINILKLANEFFEECESDEDGNTHVEFFAKKKNIVDFAMAIYNRAWREGYSEAKRDWIPD